MATPYDNPVAIFHICGSDPPFRRIMHVHYDTCNTHLVAVWKDTFLDPCLWVGSYMKGMMFSSHELQNPYGNLVRNCYAGSSTRALISSNSMKLFLRHNVSFMFAVMFFVELEFEVEYIRGDVPFALALYTRCQVVSYASTCLYSLFWCMVTNASVQTRGAGI